MERGHPANIPTRYWLTPSGVRLPTSENTRVMRSGLRGISKGDAWQNLIITLCNPRLDGMQSVQTSWSLAVQGLIYFRRWL